MRLTQDKVGRKPLISGALLGYGLTAVLMFIGTKAVDYAPFLIGGILLGFSAPLFPHAAAAVTDISPPKDLAKNMGLIQGLGIQLGLLAGSVVALIIIVLNEKSQDDDATISNVDKNFSVLETSFLVSFIIGLSGVAMLFIFFKETLHTDERGEMDWASANPLSGIRRVFRTKYFFCCGLLIFLGAFAAAATESMFLNWIITRFSLYKWKRSETFCPKTLTELNEASAFNESDADTQGSGFRCCSWDATVHQREWTTAEWGSPGAAFMPAGTASGLLADDTIGLRGAADRGNLLAPVLLRADGASCMATPGEYFSCAGFNEAVVAATAAATAQEADSTSSVFAAAAAAYATAAGAGALTAADGAAYATALGEHFPAAVAAAVPGLVPLHFIGHPNPAVGIPGTKVTFGDVNNAGCGDPLLPDDEVCPGLGFPICVPDGVDLGKVMMFLLPYFFALAMGQAVMLRILENLMGFKKQIMVLLILTAVHATCKSCILLCSLCDVCGLCRGAFLLLVFAFPASLTKEYRVCRHRLAADLRLLLHLRRHLGHDRRLHPSCHQSLHGSGCTGREGRCCRLFPHD